MSEYLASIPWHLLNHAYGQATDVPEMLRGLKSENPAEWVSAIDGLNWSIYHQGTVYSSTQYAVPYLLELAECPGVKCRPQILELLANIVCGNSFHAAHQPILQGQFETSTLQLEEKIAQEMTWVEQSRQAVWNEIDRLIKLMRDPETRLRSAAGYAVAMACQVHRKNFPGDSSQAATDSNVEKQISELYDGEPDELVKAGMVFLLETLPVADDRKSQFFQRLLQQPSSIHVELASALALIRLSDNSDPNAIDVVVRFLGCPELLQSVFLNDDCIGEHREYEEATVFPWVSDLENELAFELCQLDRKHDKRRFPGLLNSLRRVNDHDVIRTLLELLFDDSVVRPIRMLELDDLRRLACNILFSRLVQFSGSTYKLIFDRLGLPTSKWKWERLLEETKWQSISEEQAISNLIRFARGPWTDPDYVLSESEVFESDQLDLDDIPDADLYTPFLDRFKNLASLRLCSSELTDVGIAKMPHLPHLKELYLACTGITDQGIESLNCFRGLTTLLLSSTRISDPGIESLVRNHPGLKKLILYKTNITNDSVPALQSLRHLREMAITGTGITDFGYAELQKKMKRCQITWRPG